MAPLLIDGRDLLKFVLVSVVTVTAVFASGIFVGHQRAATFYQAGIAVHSLPLPERIEIAESAFESQQPEEIEAGEFIDVDHPASAVKSAAKDNDVQTMVSASRVTSASVKEVEAGSTESQIQHNTIASSEAASLPFKNRAKDNHQNNTEQLLVSSRHDAAAVVTSERVNNVDKVKYSIQVGVYGRLLNAENMVKTLRRGQYEAYITDYMNKKKETRYNVRFGYFMDKKSALASLERFKNDKQSDGYLVKFSADSIVNLADAGKTGSSQIQTEANEVSSVPAVTPSVTSTDKLSQADVLTETLIKAN